MVTLFENGFALDGLAVILFQVVAIASFYGVRARPSGRRFGVSWVFERVPPLGDQRLIVLSLCGPVTFSMRPRPASQEF